MLEFYKILNNMQTILSTFHSHFKKNYLESGYILAFALIILGVTLSITTGVVRIISKELFFSNLVNSSKEAYAAAAAGLECAEYLDTTFRYSTTPDTSNTNTNVFSIIVNSTSSEIGVGGGKNIFENNLLNNIFVKSLDNNIGEITGIDGSYGDVDIITSQIFCASDGTFNQIFNTDTDNNGNNYAETPEEVLGNLSQDQESTSSYNLIGDSLNATTTFGLVLKNEDNEITTCALVKYEKFNNGKSQTITSTGYSSCSSKDKTKASRTLDRYTVE